MDYINKRCIVNPKRGPFHYRAPGRMFRRMVRGMLPHKTTRGTKCFHQLRAYEGVPPIYNAKKKMVVPQALRVLRLGNSSKYTVLGELAATVGWKYQEVVKKLEEKRMKKNLIFHNRNKLMLKSKKKALETKKDKIQKFNDSLKQYGY